MTDDTSEDTRGASCGYVFLGHALCVRKEHVLEWEQGRRAPWYDRGAPPGLDPHQGEVWLLTDGKETSGH